MSLKNFIFQKFNVSAFKCRVSRFFPTITEEKPPLRSRGVKVHMRLGKISKLTPTIFQKSDTGYQRLYQNEKIDTG